MPITPKPYNSSLKIAQHVFKSSPSVFCAEDLNREMTGVHESLLQLSGQVGMIRDNWVINLVLSEDVVDGLDNVYNTQINLIKVNNALPAYVFYKGIRFELSVGTAINYTGTFTKPVPETPVVYLYLVAKKIEKSFTDDPVLCGINSDESPVALPAADVLQYSNERLVYTDDAALIVLAENEEIIGIIATVIAEDTSAIISAGPDLPYQYAPEMTRVVRYNAVIMKDLIDEYSFQYGDEFLGDIGMIPLNANREPHETNNSLTDLALLMREWLVRNKRYQRMVHLFYNDRFDDISSEVSDLNLLIEQMNNTLTTLLGFAQVPVGSILPYYGSQANFASSGMGLPTGPMSKFAICNGLNGTPDLRGRFLVGAINGVLSDGAPALADEVDPASVTVPAGSNPNYSMGNRGGKAVHKLTEPELPHLTFTANVLKDQDEPDLTNTGTGNNYEVDAGKTIVDFGEDLPHNNLPPYSAVIYIMRIQ